jgi:hypothetical protein
MPSQQGSLELLDHPVAQRLLVSTNMAHLAYVWPDGTPRVIPIWFHWNGSELVVASPGAAPKVNVLQDGSQVAVAIDDNSFPYKELLIRGTASVQMMHGMVEEYAAAAVRYMGEEGARAWLQQLASLPPAPLARIAIRPEWVAVIDFQSRFPLALEKAMGM